ncbi:glucans biosynthesis glucosyltransferase MdoH [Sphingomonas endophytica]|uniref:Glucans biosynthesis glucosyltransferase H n=1 Tax=Sphingomonas endophytica TaxID=869719 RepID=A0A147HWB8_9SPHN|nr:glucans biosynthesis glucosyltransferase MdoH [Sphingomonas endophytica]KTT69183.1 glucosyl transferase family 2 [Sphingomonas endophytica]
MTDTPPRLPAAAPIDMPEQRFDGPPPPGRAPEPFDGAIGSSTDLFARRAILVLLTLALALAASTTLKESVLEDGLAVSDMLLLTVFFPLFALLAFGFVNAVVGYIVLATGLHPGFTPMPRWSEPLQGRTAILMPVHNEDIGEVCGRLATMADALARAGTERAFDIFILSDSGAGHEAEEVAAWRVLAARSACAIYYRRRSENIGRKPGNIADWLRAHGGAYDYMLMLDADSLMGGDTIVGMAQIMDRRPAVALLQTVPQVIGATTLFQRWMQFSSRIYGPAATAGLVWWSGAEATFWGHNALIRIRAFAESCGLPALPGQPPFGGTIMSHDVVEAALLRRRGWRVHMVMTEETFEEYPPTLIDAAVRDRRWAQGNLQHLGLLGASGFHWVNRLQLLLGAAGYLASPLWLLLIVVSVAQAVRGEAGLMSGDPSGIVLGTTLALLFGPKLLGVIHALADARRRRSLGGGWGILRSILIDVPLSTLAAPAIAVTQTIDLIGITRQRKAEWQPQNRRGDSLAMAAILPRYRWHMVLGIVLLALSPLMPTAALWLSPVTAGLLLSPLIVQWTASERWGRRLAKRGIFVTDAPAGTEHCAPASVTG